MTAIGLLQTIPPLVFGPLIGVYLDYLPKTAIVVDLLRTLMVLLIPLFYALDLLTLERLYVLGLLVSIVSTIFGPALASAVPSDRPAVATDDGECVSAEHHEHRRLVGTGRERSGHRFDRRAKCAVCGCCHLPCLSAFLTPIRVRETKSVKELMSWGLPSWDMMVGFRFVFRSTGWCLHDDYGRPL